jgi:hypothetical protein
MENEGPRGQECAERVDALPRRPELAAVGRRRRPLNNQLMAWSVDVDKASHHGDDRDPAGGPWGRDGWNLARRAQQRQPGPLPSAGRQLAWIGCARIVPERGVNSGDKGQRATTLSPGIVALYGLCWSSVYGRLGTENPRVGGSIPHLATVLMLYHACSFRISIKKS